MFINAHYPAALVEEFFWILNNHFRSTTISSIDKDRWEIELFFKTLKQNLKVKTFIGTSENTLRIHIWTAGLLFEVQKNGQVSTLSKSAIQTPANTGNNSLPQFVLDNGDFHHGSMRSSNEQLTSKKEIFSTLFISNL